ncbi:type VI secretion system protein TssL, long form [Pontivivens ytuae]|uniref:Type VI secretion system protein TssL n=1 Tax=Pontivivens ytuae TaxID=2789856 RepID=A0A7S9LRS2_9RHOB|nr:type VI secretion system protein TssL, long form [Pontivivens ytuae]QPH54099.1 type VI secretion system protein TssL [Pontivivens ytuae]
MSRDDPFFEPTDTDKTIIRPNPAGRRPAAPTPMPPPGPAARAAPPPPAPTAGAPAVPVSTAATGLNPLNAAASTLFSLVARIRNRAQHPDPAALRNSVAAEIRAFENAALQAGVHAQTVRVARYAICATLDDVVLNTPWGGQSAWTQQGMVITFHNETHGGDRFYDLLTRLEKAPSENLMLLEFLYVCLSLGFEGRLRVAPGGGEKHLAIRDGLARLIRTHRPQGERDLSANWKGMEVAHRLLSSWTPIWVTAGLTLGGLCAVFFGFSVALAGDTERLRGQISALDVDGVVTLARAAPPPPPPPPAPQVIERVQTVSSFLAPEIAQGLVTVDDRGNTLTVRIAGQAMFASASDTLSPDYEAVVDRVAAALEEEPGRIIVAGHSDNIPINTARFPSNLQLSLARAQSVMDRMAGTLADTDRLSAEGRADREPIASNDTPEGRAQNRRIEVILVKAG